MSKDAKPGKIRVGFLIDVVVAGELQVITAQLKAKAQVEGRPLPTQSEIVENALRVETKRLRAELRKG